MEDGKVESSVNQSKAGELLFPMTKEISQEEFGQLPRYCRFNFGNKATGENCFFEVNDGKGQVGMTIAVDARGLGFDEKYEISEEGLVVSFPRRESLPEDQGGDAKQGSQEAGSYCIDGLKPRKIEDQKEVKQIIVKELAEKLGKLRGEEIVVYTGAGISMSGEKPVWGMGELQLQLGLAGNGEGKNFGEIFRDNPEELLDRVREFGDQLFADESTEAHKAIAELVRQKPGTLVMTENIDLKHEADGSRLKVTHMDSDAAAFGQVILRTPGTKMILVVGLSHDDRAILEYFKEHNRDVQIISVNKETPNFLGNEDGLVLGNCQEILPELVGRLDKKEGIENDKDPKTSGE